MSIYCVTFRIANETIGGKTYADRRQSVVEAVNSGNGYWDETTSFFLVESALNTPNFTKAASAGLDAHKDMLVAFDPSDMSMAYFGAVETPDVLASFFRSAQKL
ncbi:hypothetical protein [Shinella oryzae]|uniref:hypothetical protein n=1 Tax=Shinella oryzae TaxID=2871820 RepID=UPI001FF4906D|nr:hypothetical protein [Shinella oryzae]UPA25339.1 hypothetical protein K6301_03805 [Shinella oryzae]